MIEAGLLTRFQRIPSRIRREILRIPQVQFLSEQAYQSQLERYFQHLPSISLEDTKMLECLQQEGSFITSLDKLKFSRTEQLINAANRIIVNLQKPLPEGTHVLELNPNEIMKSPEIFLWGLEERLLDIIENYIGLPILYHGVAIRREMPTGEAVHIRQWHVDPEDYRMLKIIIYLNDVTIDGGPYEYISKPLTAASCKELKYHSGFISDKVMESVIPNAYWKACTGNYGTAVFTDTRNVFHRAKPPVARDRFSITFSYTSHKPLASRHKVKLSSNEWQSITNTLSKRQIECLGK